MQATQTTSESLEQVRALMRELIDRMQADAPAGGTQTPASLMRILVHIVNIQKTAEQSSEDPANAVKRLRDFANTIERLNSGDGTQDIRIQLIAALRRAADQFRGQDAMAIWPESETAGA